jgi:hypothetical protein
MAKKNEKDSDVFFVGIKDDREVKRNILESMKDILQSLQKFEDFRHTRLEKNRSILELKRVVKEINSLVGKLKVSLPKSNINVKLTSEEIKIEEDIIEMGKEKEQEVETQVKSQSRDSKLEEDASVEVNTKKIGKKDIDKLESELSMIESRLQGL